MNGNPLQFVNQMLAAPLLLLSIIFGAGFSVNAQVRVPFTQRTSHYTPNQQIYHLKGDFTMIGNTNLTLQDYGDTTQNGNNPMIYVDVDSPQLTGLHGTPTANSSAATLTLSTENGAVPACSNIVYAGLYWTGRAHNFAPSNVTFSTPAKNFDKRKIQFKGPASSGYTEFTAASNDIYYPVSNDDFMYSAYVEVTDYVRTNGIGEYFAADIALAQGNGGGTGYYGGWGMVVIYENSAMQYRDISIFDGHAFVQAQTAHFDIPVSGFNTVPTGPVGIKMGLMAGEGDSFYTNDYFRIRKLNSNNFLPLEHSGNTATNFFNSSIQTGGNPRNPNLLNNTGLDISMFNIPNEANSVIGNGQTSTTFRYGTTGDTYIIFAVVLAVDAYSPEPDGTISAVSINNEPIGPSPYTAEPGDEILYKIQLRNLGNEAVSNTKITIPIPYNAVYAAGSASAGAYFTPLPTPNSVTFEPTMGANGSLVWNFGTLPLAVNEQIVLADLTFKLRVTQDCDLLSNMVCSNVLAVNGTMSGTGAITGVSINNAPLIRGYTNTGLCIGVAIPGPINVLINSEQYVALNCTAPPQNISFTFCDTGGSIAVADISGGFPAGTLFYNQYPVVNGSTVQYTSTNPFPATAGTATYFAVSPGGSDGCYFQFTISVNDITSVPNPQNDTYWVGATAVPITAVATQPGYTLYYFTSQNANAQLSITPSTAVVGQTTYYVAEGPSPSCIGPLVPLLVTVNPLVEINAPPNLVLMGCGLGQLTQLPYTETPQEITVNQFVAAGGTLGLASSPCIYTISYVDIAEGTCPINLTRTFSLADNCGFSTTVVQLISIGNNAGPVFDPLPAPSTIACGATPIFATAVAVDDCEGVSTTTFVDTTTAGSCDGSYAITRAWTAQDACGNRTYASQTINFADTIPPSITNTAQNIVILCNHGIQAAISNWLANHGGATALDNCSDIVWSHDFTSEAMTCSAPLPVIFTATDACGNFSTTTATISSMDNLAPVAPAAPSNISVICSTDIPPAIPLTAIDNCEGNITVMPVEVVTPGDCANSFNIVRTWTFTDACSNSNAISQMITVSDQIAPVFNEPMPQNISISCGDIPPPPAITATDNCSTTVPVQFTESTTAGICAGNSLLTRTWRAVDDCGNFTEHRQIISISDIVAPSLVGTYDRVVNVFCGQIPPIPQLQFTDNCSAITQTYTEVITPVDTANYTIVRNWHVADDCNNSQIYSQTINVTDAPNPQQVNGYAACNSDIGLTIDLKTLLPQNTGTGGIFNDLSNTGALQNGIFTPNGLPVGFYTFSYQLNIGACPEIVEITIQVDDDCFVAPACSLLVHNAITPNGDGRNDLLLIENIDNTICFPTNNIEIYNRWGVLVYETSQYNNYDRAFKGISEGRITVDRAAELPAGTYFYILNYTTSEGGAVQKNGYLYLSR